MFIVVPACRQGTRSVIGRDPVRSSESAELKSFLLLLSFELAHSSATVEGLIQSARYRIRCLTDWLVPAGGGLTWPGGLDSPVIKLPPFPEEPEAGRLRSHSSCPEWEA
jgi:hypothetical protein